MSVCFQRKPSNPEVLARSPEMAMVDSLASSLTLTSHALFAANPELESSEFLLELPQPSVQACLADALLTHITALEAAIRSYRTYVVDHYEHRTDSKEHDF
jgi:hypothetical protein